MQLNLIIKAIFGLFTATLSERVGRRPALVTGLFILALASFCCGCAGKLEWFLAARLLQALGESLEPVLFAVALDYFPKEEDRLKIIGAMQVLAMIGMTIAPVFGGFLAEIFTWRSSFFVLAVVWSLLGLYAWIMMVESGPDVASEGLSYLEALRKIMAPDLVMLLVTNVGLQASWVVFTSNIGYVGQVTYGQSRIATSFMMLVWSGLGVAGVLRMRCHQVCQKLTAYQTAAVQILMTSVVAIISMVLSASSSQFLWAYLMASFLQAVVECSSIIPVSVLYFEPLADCAGIAASIEILFKSVPPCLFSMLCTHSLVHDGIKSFMTLQSCTVVLASAGFFVYTLLRTRARAATCELPYEQSFEGWNK